MNDNGQMYPAASEQWNMLSCVVWLPAARRHEVSAVCERPQLLNKQIHTSLDIMKSTRAILVVICSLAVVLMTSASALTAKNVIKRSPHDFAPSPHMQIADRLLKRILEITYETLQDLGASREDLEKVQQKRNYIQACYFQAISCY